MATPFNGVIKLDVRDSTPDWAPFIADEGARGRAERPDRPVRRHRAGGLVAVRRADQHADAPEARRQRPDVQPVAHDRAVLADPVDLPDRSQPPPERDGLHHRGLDRLPGRQRAHPAGVRDDGRGPAPGRLEHLLAGQEPQRAGRRPGPGRDQGDLAAPPGLGPLLRLPRRRDQQLVSGPRRRQPLHRPAVHARGGLPPLEGPRRPGDPDDPGRQGQRAVTALAARGSARAPTTRRTTRRRSTSTSTRASSTTATRPTASGSCRG